MTSTFLKKALSSSIQCFENVEGTSLIMSIPNLSAHVCYGSQSTFSRQNDVGY